MAVVRRSIVSPVDARPPIANVFAAVSTFIASAPGLMPADTRS
jgi:hypothetical protein